MLSVESNSGALVQPQHDSRGRPLQITPLERQALQLLAVGASLSQVSIGLGLSAAETEAFLTRLYAAMGVATRADAVASAQRRALLEREQSINAPCDAAPNHSQLVALFDSEA
jgi:DNA-binding CsgD family transcriptional regulator